MPTIRFLSGFSLLFLLLCACQKEIATISSDETRRTKMEAFMQAGNEVDFKHDFRRSKLPDDVPPRVRPTDVERSLLNIAASQDHDRMRSHYSTIKIQLQEWIHMNENDQYSWAIQNIGLRYLRTVFLTEATPEHQEETAFLLQLLIDNGAVDIDVLVDAFILVEETLSEGDRSFYLDYLRSLYTYEINYWEKATRQWKTQCESVTTQPERYKCQLRAKGLERRLLAYAYARATLPILVNE